MRAALGLRAPPRRLDLEALLAPAAIVLALALAAAQPAYSTGTTQRVRTDAEALFVFDISQSMAARPSRGAPSRLERAKAAGERLRAAIPQVRAGVATLTDRVLPDLLPVADVPAFDATLERAVAIESPPPRSAAVRATAFAALTAPAQGGYFEPATSRRLVVLLSDGETAPFDPGVVGRAYDVSRMRLVVVRFWRAGEAVYDGRGNLDPHYRPDPTSADQMTALAGATRGRSFGEGDLGGAAAAVRTALGTGPSRPVGRTARIHPLAPYVALAALVPLLLVFRRRGPDARLRRVLTSRRPRRRTSLRPQSARR